MIDLDSMEGLLADYKEQSSLYITFGLWLCLDKIQYVDFLKITRWLGVHHYVLPAKRACLSELSDYLYRNRRYNLFGLALLVSHVEAHYTEEHQMILLETLQQRVDDSMEKMPENRDILTSDASDFTDYPEVN